MTLKQACDLLQIEPDATIEEATESYNRLRSDYREKQFESGEAGNNASKMLDKLMEAYDLFKRESQSASKSQTGSAYFERVEQYIKNGDITTAQEMLDDTTDRGAEWHYMQSIIYYKKNWYVESKKQLEMSVSMDPTNEKYQNSLNKLNKILSSKSVSPDKMSGENTSRPVNDPYAGGGNGTCTGSCCGDICLANLCCDCCQCCCR